MALPARTGASVSYASGRVVNTMSQRYTGEGKTDAKDAYVNRVGALAATRRPSGFSIVRIDG
jgi:hypothetical protein